MLCHYVEEDYTNDRRAPSDLNIMIPSLLFSQSTWQFKSNAGRTTLPRICQSETAFHVTNQGKAVLVHDGIWTASTTWGGAVVCSMERRWRFGGPYDTHVNRSVLLVRVCIRQSLNRRQESIGVHGARFALLRDLPLTIGRRAEDVFCGIRVAANPSFSTLSTRSLPQTPVDYPVKRWDAWELEEVGK